MFSRLSPEPAAMVGLYRSLAMSASAILAGCTLSAPSSSVVATDASVPAGENGGLDEQPGVEGGPPLEEGETPPSGGAEAYSQEVLPPLVVDGSHLTEPNDAGLSCDDVRKSAGVLTRRCRITNIAKDPPVDVKTLAPGLVIDWKVRAERGPAPSVEVADGGVRSTLRLETVERDFTSFVDAKVSRDALVVTRTHVAFDMVGFLVPPSFYLVYVDRRGSERLMTADEAKAYCRDHGGRLATTLEAALAGTPAAIRPSWTDFSASLKREGLELASGNIEALNSGAIPAGHYVPWSQLDQYANATWPGRTLGLGAPTDALDPPAFGGRIRDRDGATPATVVDPFAAEVVPTPAATVVMPFLPLAAPLRPLPGAGSARVVVEALPDGASEMPVAAAISGGGSWSMPVDFFLISRSRHAHAKCAVSLSPGISDVVAEELAGAPAKLAFAFRINAARPVGEYRVVPSGLGCNEPGYIATTSDTTGVFSVEIDRCARHADALAAIGRLESLGSIERLDICANLPPIGETPGGFAKIGSLTYELGLAEARRCGFISKDSGRAAARVVHSQGQSWLEIVVGSVRDPLDGLSIAFGDTCAENTTSGSLPWKQPIPPYDALTEFALTPRLSMSGVGRQYAIRLPCSGGCASWSAVICLRRQAAALLQSGVVGGALASIDPDNFPRNTPTLPTGVTAAAGFPAPVLSVPAFFP